MELYQQWNQDLKVQQMEMKKQMDTASVLSSKVVSN